MSKFPPISSQSAPSPISEVGRATRTRYWVVVFAVALAVIQYIDRVCISQAAPFISRDLHLNDAEMGWVFSAFTLAYALFEIPSGYLGDRIGPRKVLLRIVLWWSFFTAATGWVMNWFSLLATRFLFGAGEAGCFPNLTKAFNRWLPTSEHTRAQGALWMCARLGGAFTPLLVYACLQWVSWRVAFGAFGLLGIVWAIVFAMWFRDNPREHPSVNAAEARLLPEESGADGHFRVPWRLLLRSRTVWCLCGQYFACSYSFYFFITWFPTYLQRARGFDLKESAVLATTPLMVGAFGALFAGALLPILSRWHGDAGWARRWMGATGCAGGAALLVGVVELKNPYLAVAAIALVAFCNDIQMPGAWTACMDVGGRSVATLSGTMNMVGNIGGFLSSVVCGSLVEWTGNWNVNFYVTAAIYIVAIFFWLAMDPTTPLEEQT